MEVTDFNITKKKKKEKLKIVFFFPGEKGKIACFDYNDGRVTVKKKKKKEKKKSRITFLGASCPFTDCTDHHLFVEVFTTATTRSGKEGWITYAQGECKNGPIELRNTYLELENNTPREVMCTMTIKNCRYQQFSPSPPPLLNQAERDYITLQSRFINSTLHFCFPFQRVYQKTIAVHLGRIPREMFYYDSKGAEVSETFLYNLFIRWGGLEQLTTITRKEEFEQCICSIIFAATSFVSNVVEYQKDAIDDEDVEHFSKGVAYQFLVGDCEELAWLTMALLIRLRDRQLDSTKLDLLSIVLRHFVIGCCLVQATEPEYSKQMIQQQNELPKEQKFHNEQEEREICREFDGAYHMTCILYSAEGYEQRISPSPPIKKWPYELPFTKFLPPNQRYFAESTICVFPDPEMVDVIDDQLCNKLSSFALEAKEHGGDRVPLCVPIGKNNKRASLPYGGVLQILTADHYEKFGMDTLALFPVLLEQREGTKLAAPAELHWVCEFDRIRLIKGASMSGIFNNEECIMKSRYNLPYKKFTLPRDFNKLVNTFNLHMKGRSWKERMTRGIISDHPLNEKKDEGVVIPCPLLEGLSLLLLLGNF